MGVIPRHRFFGESCKEDEPGNLKYELRDSKYEVIVRHTAKITAATYARLCYTAPQAPDSELRTPYIVIRTFKYRFSVMFLMMPMRLQIVDVAAR